MAICSNFLYNWLWVRILEQISYIIKGTGKEIQLEKDMHQKQVSSSSSSSSFNPYLIRVAGADFLQFSLYFSRI